MAVAIYSFVSSRQELSGSILEVGNPAMEFLGENVTDDELGSIMEQLSQLAGSTGDHFLCLLLLYSIVQL
jgi:hypothetical protein